MYKISISFDDNVLRESLKNKNYDISEGGAPLSQGVVTGGEQN